MNSIGEQLINNHLLFIALYLWMIQDSRGNFNAVSETMNNTSNGVRPLMHTVKSACQQLDISKSTVYKLVETGRLDARKLAGRTVITDASLVQFAAEAPKAPIRSVLA